MKVLTTAKEISHELARLIKNCTSCQVAVAWASVGFDAFDLLLKHRAKVSRMVVGTHFYQTHPDFIESFLSDPNVRFTFAVEGVFHPKVYLFEKPQDQWECLIGSPNFTRGGLESNQEAAVLISNCDNGADAALASVKSAIGAFWNQSKTVSEPQLHVYREAWKRKRPLVKQLSGKYGNPFDNDADDHGKSPLAVPLLQSSWGDYFDRVRAEKNHDPGENSLDGRLKVLRVTAKLMAAHPHFEAIDLVGRKQLAGLLKTREVNFLWFGSMRGAGRFKKAINDNDLNLSQALDVIPSSGVVTREAYLAYMKTFQAAFPHGGGGMATATRLLAMKRPDWFLCLDSRNKEGLCRDFDISRNVGPKEYWDSIIQRVVSEAPWWSAACPQSGVEKEVWEARVAFVDSWYYDGKDMPSS